MNETPLHRIVASCRPLAILLVIITGFGCALRAGDEVPAASTVGADPEEPPPDLTFHSPIEAGHSEFRAFCAAIPGFALVGARLDPDSGQTRLMVGIRFSSRSIGSARLRIALLDSYRDSNTIHQVTHIEALGPDRVTTKGRNLDLVRDWDDDRALWFNFPIEARRAKAFRVEAWLERKDG